MSVKRPNAVEPDPARYKRTIEVPEARALQRRALRRIEQLRAAVADPMSFSEDIGTALDRVYLICEELAEVLFDPEWGATAVLIIPPGFFDERKEPEKPEA